MGNNFVTTAPACVQTPKGAGPSAGTVLKYLKMFTFKFLWLSTSLVTFTCTMTTFKMTDEVSRNLVALRKLRVSELANSATTEARNLQYVHIYRNYTFRVKINSRSCSK